MHESGIPPIHTPLHILNKLDEDIKDKIRVYHVAAHDIENLKESKLQWIKIGLKNTIVLLKSRAD